jgi:hypothetical protein
MITLVVAVVGAGSFGSYWIIRALKTKYDERDRQQEYSFEDRRSQLASLRDFLGKPSANFAVLMGAGNTYDEQSRRQMIQPIREWIEVHRALYDRLDHELRVAKRKTPN